MVQQNGCLLWSFIVVAHLGTDRLGSPPGRNGQERSRRDIGDHPVLTFSTASKTLSRLLASAPLTSVSVHFLLSSSAIRSGYLETSSRPSGRLCPGQENWTLLCPRHAFPPQPPQDTSVGLSQVEVAALTCRHHHSPHRSPQLQLLPLF